MWWWWWLAALVEQTKCGQSNSLCGTRLVWWWYWGKAPLRMSDMFHRGIRRLMKNQEGEREEEEEGLGYVGLLGGEWSSPSQFEG